MSKLEVIREGAERLSEAVAGLLAVCTFAPTWKGQFGWRHRNEQKEVSLYWLTKLAGISSTINAAVALASEGYWFQVAILARSITEAQLSIALTLPKPNMKAGEWPSNKQKQAVENHYKETWDDPESPYENDRLRPHIRDLAASIGHFQNKGNVINPHDSSQTALQWMRFLSDYTHMAYPQLMEFLDGNRGYVLSGKQKSSSFGEDELGRLLSDSYAFAESVAGLLEKIISSCEKNAEAEKNTKGIELFRAKHKKLNDMLSTLEERGKVIEANFPLPDDEIKKILRNFKNR